MKTLSKTLVTAAAVTLASSTLFIGSAFAGSGSAGGDICKSSYESSAKSRTLNGEFRVGSASVMVTCPINHTGFGDQVTRVDVVTTGITASEPSYVRCYASGATDGWASNRNYFLLQGANVRSVQCFLRPGDKVVAVSWFN